MKLILNSTVAVLTLLLGVAAYGKDGSIKVADGSNYSISVGESTLVVDASKGARIISFTCGGKDIISHLDMTPYSFGSTFWPSPQSLWMWPPIPEIDELPYDAQTTSDALILTSKVSEKHPFKVVKKFVPNEKKGCIEITYSMTNESNVEKQVAPWEITRVLNSGVIFFDADPSQITPADLIPFKQSNGLSWYEVDETKANRKINADGKGWYAYSDNGLLLIKKFPDLDSSQPAPREAEIQVYVNAGKTYIELEAQGQYTTLAPGASLDWTVEWYLVPVDDAAEPSEALAKAAREIIK